MTDDRGDKPTEGSGKMSVEKGLALLVAAIVVGAFALLLIQGIILQ